MSDNKFYDLGVVCGRFGHEHLGHVALFDNCMALCNKTLILVGSSQEHGTLRNPFKIETRIDVIKETYPNMSEDTLMIKGIRDLTNEYDVNAKWGKFVKSEVERHEHQFANLMVYGNDEFRSHWFDPEDLSKTAELIVPRSANPISATTIRGLLVIGDKKSWQENTHPLVHNMYDRLRDEILSVTSYKKIYDEIKKYDFSLDSFMNIYKKLEEIDKIEKLNSIK